jgi:hypothetical protein
MKWPTIKSSSPVEVTPSQAGLYNIFVFLTAGLTAVLHEKFPEIF